MGLPSSAAATLRNDGGLASASRIARKGEANGGNSKSVTFENNKMMCGLHEEFDQPEEEITLKGHELVIFAVIYIVCVLSLIVFYETIMPVVNNPTYPFYNIVPDYSYKG